MPSYTDLKGYLGMFSSGVQQHLGFAHSSGFEIILDHCWVQGSWDPDSIVEAVFVDILVLGSECDIRLYGLMRFPCFVKSVDLVGNGRGSPENLNQLSSQERHPKQYWRRPNGLSINCNCEDSLSNMPRQM